jgi:peptide/nickel transport system permease protein
MADTEQDLQTTEHGVQVHEVPATSTEREFTVQRRSQTQMILRRFMAHKLAVGSLVVFLLVVVISLIGGRFWRYSYSDITKEFSSPPSLAPSALAASTNSFSRRDRKVPRTTRAI